MAVLSHKTLNHKSIYAIFLQFGVFVVVLIAT